MKKIDTIFEQETDSGTIGELGIDDNGNLYWNKKLVLTKSKVSLKWWVNISILITAFSALVTAAYPIWKDFKLDQCLSNAEGTLARKNSEIRSHISDLNNEKENAQRKADEKLVEFLKNNPDPENNNGRPMTTLDQYISQKLQTFSEKFSQDIGTKKMLWRDKQYAIFSSVRDIEDRIRDIESDFKKVEMEKDVADEICYKKYESPSGLRPGFLLNRTA